MNKSQLDSLSPSKIKTHLSIVSSNNINLPTERSNHKPDLIQDLYSKFMTLNSQVTIDHDQSAFNMIEYHHKDAKMESDQQIVMAKLKRLENNAELKRIDMQIENRKKKLSKHKHKEYFVLPQREKYMNTYRDFTEKKIPPSFTSFQTQKHNTDSEDEGHGQVERPKGISFFVQLKKHPKLLQYTVQQAKSREKLKLQEIYARKQKIDGFKNELKAVANNPAFKQTLNRQKHKETSPQRVADNIFRRFYTRKSKVQTLEQARAQTRISHFLDKQQSIMNSVEERSLSKQNYQKLKQKMSSIVNELYDDEKKHRSKTKLPSISQKSSVNNTIDK